MYREAAEPRDEGRGVFWMILLLAFSTRLIAALLGPKTPVNDALFYDIFARLMLDGHGYMNVDASPAVKWVPGWPAVMALSYWIFGPTLQVALLTNAVLGTGAVALLMLLGERLFDARLGRSAGLLYAIWPGVVFFSAVAMGETAFGFFATLFLYVLVRFGRQDSGRGSFAYVGIGVVFTAALMVREEMTVLLPAALAWLLAVNGVRKRTLKGIALLLLTIGLCLTPWTIRNWLQFERFLPTSANSGIAFYHANHPRASGKANFYLMLNLRAKHAQENFSQTTIALNDAGYREGLNWIRSNPQRWIELMPMRIQTSYGGDTWGGRLAWDTPPGREERPKRLFALADGYWFGILGLALVGLSTVRRWNPDARVLVLGSYGALFLMKFTILGMERYHFGDTIFLALLAAWGLRRLAERLTPKKATRPTEPTK